VIVRRSPTELQKMRKSGVLVYEILHKLGAMVTEGTALSDLEAAAAKMMADAGAKPAFKNYKPASAIVPYQYVLCTSVNHEIVHGMPSKGRKVRKGDIVSIDTGLCLDGYYGDSAITVPVGEISERAKSLLRVTLESLEKAIEQVKVGNRLFDISGAVEKHVTGNGFSVVREMVGHGIGTKLHEEPQVPNYVDRTQENPRLKEGMVMAIEPMVNMGKADMAILPDKWTAVAVDGLPSAHFEHVVAVTADGPWVLTRP
jgi:methionyl aminopeptidase